MPRVGVPAARGPRGVVECEVVPFRHSRGRSPNPATMRNFPPETGRRVRRQKPRASTSANPFANRFRSGRTREVRVRAPARRAARQKAKRIAEYCGEDCSNARTAGCSTDDPEGSRPRQRSPPGRIAGEEQGGEGWPITSGERGTGSAGSLGERGALSYTHLGEKAPHCATIRGRGPSARRRRGEPAPRASTSANPFANRFRAGQTGVPWVPGSRLGN